jgi:hypothetical protein
MQNAIFQFDIQLENERQRPLYLGIGVNTGDFAGGNIGGTHRMEYTVIGDNVNLAQRIESLASRWQILVAEETYKAVRNYCSVVKLPPATVKGRMQPITVYSIRGMLQYDNSMLLTIPLIIMTPEGAISGSGLAVRYVTVNENAELHIETVATIPSWSTLMIQFDLPEIAISPRLTGIIRQVSRRNAAQNSPYSHIILTDLTGDTTALTLLRAGACYESKKNWEDMKRH